MDAIVGGLVSGGLYALIAQSFVLTFLTTRTLNFAVGEFMAVAAFLGLAVSGWGSLPAAAKIALAVVALGAAGAVGYRLLIVPFSDGGQHDVRWLLSTVGVSFIALNLLTDAEGANPQNLGFGRVDAFPSLLGVKLSGQSLLLAGLALAVTVGLALMTTRTPLGLFMRAVSADARTASLMGVSPRAVGMLAYALAMGIAALAGVLWAAEVGVTPGRGRLARREPVLRPSACARGGASAGRPAAPPPSRRARRGTEPHGDGRARPAAGRPARAGAGHGPRRAPHGPGRRGRRRGDLHGPGGAAGARVGTRRARRSGRRHGLPRGEPDGARTVHPSSLIGEEP